VPTEDWLDCCPDTGSHYPAGENSLIHPVESSRRICPAAGSPNERLAGTLVAGISRRTPKMDISSPSPSMDAPSTQQLMSRIEPRSPNLPSECKPRPAKQSRSPMLIFIAKMEFSVRCDTKSLMRLLCLNLHDTTQCSAIGTLPGCAAGAIQRCKALGTM
jgi:hypothetical protein